MEQITAEQAREVSESVRTELLMPKVFEGINIAAKDGQNHFIYYSSRYTDVMISQLINKGFLVEKTPMYLHIKW